MTTPLSFRGRQRGVSLIITLIMLVIIGLTAASAMRGAASSEQVVNSLRLQNLAQQYAEGSLRYCETQIGLADASRVATLREAQILAPTGSVPSWQVTATWVGGATRFTTVPASQIRSADSSIIPGTLPQCFAERATLPDGSTAIIITARGFSPDYTANSTTGQTLTGSVVWLQSVVVLS